MKYTVTISDGYRTEVFEDISWGLRNLLADFAFRHNFECIVTEIEEER